MRNLRTTGVAWLLGVLVPLLAQAHPPLDAQSKRRLDGLLTSTVPCADNVVCDLQAGTTIGGSPIGGGGGAPTNATYLVQDLNAGLSAEIAFGAAVANQCVTGVAAGAVTRSQPDFSWLTGTATDAQIPNTITIDLATTATTANAGDSATAFFPSGTLEDARVDGSLEADEVNPTLGSQTQGNYVATVATGGLLTGGAAGSEGTAISLSTSMATNKLVGRSTIGTGVMEEITLGTNLSFTGTTLNAAGGSGEVNTASNLGGGLANWDSKSGVDLRFNSFAAADFDLASNLLTIDATKWLTISAAAAAYQPLDSDLTSVAALTTTTGGRSILATTPADDQVYVGDSASAGTWRAVPDCGESGTLNYTAATNLFSCLTDSGGGGGNSVEVNVVFTSDQPTPAPIVVTGQTWVASGSEILCRPFGTTADGLTPEAIMVSDVQFMASDRVVGTGFTLHSNNPNGLEGTVRAHCTGI